MELTTNTLTIGDLPHAAFETVKRRLSWMQQIKESPKVLSACESIATIEGVCPRSIHRIYRNWKKRNESWEALIDRRYMPKTWVREKSVKLPAAFIGHFRLLCEENQRSSKAAHRKLLQQLNDWRSGAGDPIPGYDFPPDNQPGREFPNGWGYSNLMKQKPTDVQLAAARLGRSAAKQLLPSVYTTRVHMYPFAEIQFDDMWHDFEIWMAGHDQGCRLLEFGAVDYYSGYIFPSGLKPRLKKAAPGENKQLDKRDFRFFLAFFLTQWGYHPEGTILNVENGTAAISADLEEYLFIATNKKVRVVRSGMSGQSALPGRYSERSKGNFRVKSYKEGIGSLIHSELACLPGNVGKDRDHMPQENWGRNREHKLLMKVLDLKPELADKIDLGFLSYQEAQMIIHKTYDKLNERHDHKIEGFMEAELYVDEIRLSESINQWISPAALLELPEEERFAISAMVRRNPKLKNRRLMSPREVLERERHKLIKMPSSTLPHLLGKEAGKLKVVRQLQFHLEGEEIGGKRKYIAEYVDRNGFPTQIQNGTKWLVFINPFAPDRLIVADPDTNEFLGECAEHTRVDRRDMDAIREQSSKMERIFRDAVAETGVRVPPTKIERQRRNAKVIREACNGSERKINGLDSSALLTEESFDEPEFIESEHEEIDPLLYTEEIDQ